MATLDRGLPPQRRPLATTALGVLLLCAATPNRAEERTNRFDDPFVHITAGLPRCPVPDPPGYTEQEAAGEAHYRSQRGVSCWLAGRCRLPNAYLYDAEIIPRVQLALRGDGRFGATTSLWATGQRRWVRLQGCVATAEQAAEAERIVRGIDDVEGVVNELMVGTEGPPPYRSSAR